MDDSTACDSIPPPFDSHLTAIRPRYDYSTTYVTTVGQLVVGCCTAAGLQPADYLTVTLT